MASLLHLRMAALLLAAGLGRSEGEPFRVRFDLERLRMPVPGERMGQVFVALELGRDRGFYGGPALWGAVEGRRGGHIGLGLEGGFRWSLTDHWVAGAGLSLTAGGGAGVNTGGGLAYRPHLDLRGRWGSIEAGLTWSRMRFPSGSVASSQVGLSLVRAFRGPDLWRDLGGEPAREQRLELLLQRWSHPDGLKRLGGARAQDRPGFLGAAWSLQGAGAAFLTVEANAAASGEHAGYMDVLAGGGLQTPLDGGDRWHLRGALLVGPAGGGALDLGGGMLLKGLLGLAFRSGRQEWTVEGGLVRAPGSGFTARTLGLRTGRLYGAPGRGGTGPWRYTFGWQRLPRTQRGPEGAEAPGIGLLQLGGFHDLGAHAYLGFHTGFAASGGAGSYATGALGPGFQTGPLGGGHRLLMELRLGAGGGGGLNTRGGATMQPMAGWRLELPTGWGLQVLGGRVKSLRGRLDSPVFEVACVLSRW